MQSNYSRKERGFVITTRHLQGIYKSFGKAEVLKGKYNSA